MTSNSDFLLQCLDKIEQKETRLLVWGIVDSSFEKADLEEFLDPFLDKYLNAGNDHYFTSAEIVETLCDKGLLHRFSRNGFEYYRSRMAETVRLMSRLRQLFPRHRDVNGWQQGATLVADYRFLRRRRKFPRREVSIVDVLTQLGSISGLTHQVEILEQLLNRSKDIFLAGFQVRGNYRILKNCVEGRSSGTIVSSGTGSGKTLAFYLPALTQITNIILGESSSLRWVKALAIYPRNELLKDQFSEVYAETRRLDKYLSGKGKRKLQIGAFFGPTPFSAESINSEQAGWKRISAGYACEYIRCPKRDCHDGVLVWRDGDRERNIERLNCTSCGYKIDEDEIILTRKRLQCTPPDILFSSTEMLNQRMSDSWSRHLFGLGPRAIRAPHFLLLDEVHTYVGMHGAQVAYLIRRWRHLVQQNVTFVGLSATLKEAPTFFADLVGLKEEQVEEVSPKVEELEDRGAEYLLALRGDPVSRRSLLSTTIQTTILAARVLDPQGKGQSSGVFGSKVFVFTDDIDVTNRLYFNTLDAEGRDSFGNPDPQKQVGGLAVLRQSSLNNLRYDYGQDWKLCEDLGHDLSMRLGVGRTTSQDPGVHVNRDIIVATGALEVGYNDPMVGIVIQHKAPRDMAQFIQRKGRAGRPMKMRPWTIAVLSDYGRDRLAYQGYDLLFDPELSARNLPISNRYIQRMQVVYALIDYLGVCLQGIHDRGSVWQELSRPNKNVNSRTRIIELIKQIKNLLQSDQMQNDFRSFIQKSLCLGVTQNEQETSLSLLWDHPRSLLTTVLPTALRRLATNWTKDSVEGEDYYVANSPLPEFIPGNLFSDLNLPDVEIIMPPQKKGANDFIATMPIFQAMRDFAPGRVSRRFTILHKYVRHWLHPKQITPQEGEHLLDVSEIGDLVELGIFEAIEDQELRAIPVYRILKLRPNIPPPVINDTSNARMEWSTQVVTNSIHSPIEIPKNCGWEQRIEGIEFYLHNNQNPVEVRRFTTGSRATISHRNGNPFQANFRFVKNQKSVALGVTQFVDGILFRLKIPDTLWDDAAGYDSAKWRALRTTRFFDLAWKGDVLSRIESPFARDWLAQIYMSALVSQALKQEVSLEKASERLRIGSTELGLLEVLEIIFQSNILDNGTESVENENQDRLREELSALISNPEYVRELENLGELCLWGEVDSSWQPWLRKHYTATVAAAIFQAVESLCPDLDTETLIVDIEHYHKKNIESIDEIWITEKNVGGCGVIEEIVVRFGEDPRRFFGLVDSSLQPTEFELIDKQLVKILSSAIDESGTFGELFKHVRATSSLEAEGYYKKLRKSMQEDGFILFHSFFSALNNRVLRPGSSNKTDRFLFKAISYWQEQENRVGIEIDARVISYILSDWTDIDEILSVENTSEMIVDKRRWRFNTAYGLLWPRGIHIRQKNLSIYNSFSDFPQTERLFFDKERDSKAPLLQVNEENWQSKCRRILSENAVLRIICPNEDKYKLKAIFNFFMTNPIEDDYLLLYPRMKSIQQNINDIVIVVEIAEAIQ
jgi:hypothetical protein